MHIYSPTVKVIEVDGERELLKGRGGGDRCRVRTLRRSTERRPLRMHSLSPVPSTITSYSTSMAGAGGRAVPEGGREESVDLQRFGGSMGGTSAADGREERSQVGGRGGRLFVVRPSPCVSR